MFSKTKTVTFSIAAALVLAASGLSQSFAENKPQSQVMSYAPAETFDTRRFDQFNLDESNLVYEEDHELNDAWLGLSAYSQDGKYVGYVEDAILDENGYVTELIVGTANSNIAVQIEADYAEFKEDRVHLTISQREFASILTDGEIVATN